MLAQIEAGETAVAAAPTTLHLQTVLDQIGLQLNKYDGAEATGNATALRGTADNLLDIIDIVQGDANLNVAAGGNGMPGHAGGFAEMPGGLTGTVHQIPGQPGADQFLGRVPGRGQHHQRAICWRSPTARRQATQALITQIQNYQHFGANFDAAQGAVFQGRFDNELVQRHPGGRYRRRDQGAHGHPER